MVSKGECMIFAYIEFKKLKWMKNIWFTGINIQTLIKIDWKL